MADLSIMGTIKQVLPMRQTSTGKSMLDIVVEEQGQQYPDSIVMTIVGDTIQKINPQVGMFGIFKFHTRANQSKQDPSKWFMGATCWAFNNPSLNNGSQSQQGGFQQMPQQQLGAPQGQQQFQQMPFGGQQPQQQYNPQAQGGSW